MAKGFKTLFSNFDFSTIFYVHAISSLENSDQLFLRVCFSHLHHACYICHPSHVSRFNGPNNIENYVVCHFEFLKFFYVTYLNFKYLSRLLFFVLVVSQNYIILYLSLFDVFLQDTAS